jgi:hypothetical protein
LPIGIASETNLSCFLASSRRLRAAAACDRVSEEVSARCLIEIARSRFNCGNCGARFVAWYGNEEDSGTEIKDVEKCLCGGDPFKKDNFKDAVLRLIPSVTARNVKREKVSA